MDYVHGKIYSRGRFRTGIIGYENGEIITVSYTNPGKLKYKASASGLVIPTFYNSHIHLADSFLFGQYADSTIKNLVDPRSGSKMKKLKNASERTIVKNTRYKLDEMIRNGTSSFIDFRELGLRGIKSLKKSMKGLPVECLVMGRPYGMSAKKREIDDLLLNADGIGLSALRDWPDKEIEEIANAVKREKKLFALHVSESVRENIKKVLELDPDFIIHMISATKKDLLAVSEYDIPIVVCPRANMFYGKYPDITAMVESDNTVLLGTDNAMITTPNMLLELEFAFKCAKLKGGITPHDLLKIAFHNPRRLFEPAVDIDAAHFEPGRLANFIVLNIPNLKSFAHPGNLLCLGISSSQIDLVSIKNFVWRRLK